MLDHTDMKILKVLITNSRITMKELGEIVHLTGPATAARVAKLEDNGIIEGYTIEINQSKLGYPIHAFLTIITQSVNHQPYLNFIKTQGEFLINNYKISGEGCYLLECKFPSNKRMDQFLEELNQFANYKLSIAISLT
ncbi:Lrp/AsnC family transcriptional regulator [Listeria kieliensis]|uniref:Transcriptional regulator n=1 Tax=Listeria kieliensis TaxID=1621700 RepID=A0A3D8TRE2_9LIST|nr:Lrp/AsnC family transcriptional regulator [Listeria kieliensis]RDX01174.1 transcriptional regulator [Listeria kieliensis]